MRVRRSDGQVAVTCYVVPLVRAKKLRLGQASNSGPADPRIAQAACGGSWGTGVQSSTVGNW